MGWFFDDEEDRELKLNSELSENSSADLGDVYNVKMTLGRYGLYKPNKKVDTITPYPDKELFDSIQNFQSASNLTADRVMKPGGETEKKINEMLRTEQLIHDGYKEGAKKGLILASEKILDGLSGGIYGRINMDYKKGENEFYTNADNAGVNKGFSRGALKLLENIGEIYGSAKKFGK